MFEAKILSGIWDEEIITLKGMPKDFVLSARNLVVLETEEYAELQAENKQLRKALVKIKEHENYLGIGNVYYDAIVFTIATKALKGE